MARQPEAKFRDKMMRDLKKIPNSYWTRIEQQSTRGTLDIHGHIGGFAVFIEPKKDESSTRPGASSSRDLQAYTILKYKETGAIAFFCYPDIWDEVLTELYMLYEVSKQTAQLWKMAQVEYIHSKKSLN